MKKFYLLLVQMTCSFVLIAQSPASIHGVITTSEGLSAEYATVIAMLAKDSTMVKAGYSELGGKYEIGPITPDKYYIQVTFVGFADFTSEVFEVAEGEQYETPTIQLNSNSQQFEEVVVKAKRPLVEIKPDRTVFNVKEV